MPASSAPKNLTNAILFICVCLNMVRSGPASVADEAADDYKPRINRMLFLGNSITLHGPAPQIGWTGNWGMAASAIEKDYVHLLLKRVTAATAATPKVMIRNIADFERRLTDFNIAESLKDELTFRADIVILAIGENAAAPTNDDERKRFTQAITALLDQLKQHGQPAIYVRSQFWPDQEKDRLLKQACETNGCIFVDLENAGAKPENSARAERDIKHDGVAGHPGDKGMAAIAEKLWAAIEHQEKLRTSVP